MQWLAGEVDTLGVDLRLGAYAEAADVLDENPDVVIVSTGGLPNSECVEGSDHVVSLWDVLSGQVQPGSNILLFDDHGDHQGPSGAEFLAGQGAKVERGAPQPLGPAGTFSLFRVDDAVASCNIHAALYDSLRICKDL